MASIIQKLSDEYKKKGFRAALQKLGLGLYEKVAIRDDVLIIFKDYSEDMKFTREHNLDIRPIDDSNKDELRNMCRNNKCNLRDMSRLDSYLRNNFQGFVAYEKGKMIGYLWWVHANGPEEEHHPHLALYGLPLKRDEIYTFDFFVIDEHRGDGNAIEFFTRAQLNLRDNGYNKAFAVVQNNNIPAKWTYASNGWKNGHIVKIIRFFKFILVASNPKLSHKQVFIKNNRMYSSHSIDYQLLFPRKAVPAEA